MERMDEVTAIKVRTCFIASILCDCKINGSFFSEEEKKRGHFFNLSWFTASFKKFKNLFFSLLHSLSSCVVAGVSQSHQKWSWFIRTLRYYRVLYGYDRRNVRESALFSYRVVILPVLWVYHLSKKKWKGEREKWQELLATNFWKNSKEGMIEANDFVPVYVSIWVVQMKVISSKITSLESPLFRSVLSLSLSSNLRLPSLHFFWIKASKMGEWNETERCSSGMKDGLERWNEGRGVRGRKPTFFNSNAKRMYYCCEFITILDRCSSFSLPLCSSLFPFFFPLPFPLTPSHYCPSSPGHHGVDTYSSLSPSHSSLHWMEGRRTKNKRQERRKWETDERG